MRTSIAVWVVWTLALLVSAPAPGLAADSSAPEAKAARRRWALARMDEMANERLRCRQRFQKRREIETCETTLDRRAREYNEIYLEAARD
jgi:hypothetical protein